MKRALLALAAAVALAACGGDEGGSEGSDAGAERAARGALADTVPVALGEYFIDMPDTLPTAVRALEVTNHGIEAHDLWIRPREADSVVASTSAPLDPGETRTLPLALEPGRYYLNCELANHEGRGMHRTVVVAAERRGEG